MGVGDTTREPRVRSSADRGVQGLFRKGPSQTLCLEYRNTAPNVEYAPTSLWWTAADFSGLRAARLEEGEGIAGR